MKPIRLWISRDGSKGEAPRCEVVWDGEPSKDKNGSFFNGIGKNFGVIATMQEGYFGIDIGECAEFEIKRVTKKRGVR